jgi:nitrate/nitrite transport system ATP-binding protein
MSRGVLCFENPALFNMAFLEIKNASKSFGFGKNRTEVLRDIQLEVAEGEFVAIVGYSGSGKTTLINLIAGLLRPNAGTLTINGAPITGPGPDRGIVFQNYSLLPWLSVAENVALAVDQVFPQWSAARRAEQVAKFIAMVNLTPARDKKPHELSGGMRQRVSVARALAMDPKILLLDEPLGALDALTRGTLQQEIGQISQESGKTVLLITNDVDEALLLADRVIPLTMGPGATLGPAFVVDKPKPRNRHMINHDPDFKRLRARIIEFLLDCGAQKKLVIQKKLVLPDLEPEDLTHRGPVLFGKPRPRRKNTIRRENVEVNV